LTWRDPENPLADSPSLLSSALIGQQVFGITIAGGNSPQSEKWAGHDDVFIFMPLLHLMSANALFLPWTAFQHE
jgi:hypothetical protein